MNWFGWYLVGLAGGLSLGVILGIAFCAHMIGV